MARLAPKAGIHCEARPGIPPHPTMEQKRVLIVEPDNAYALSLASLYREDGCATCVAASAAEAELEIATRRPDLVVVRVELPDLSGFSLCARLRHDRAMQRLPVVLYSSETAPESLAEHARTPWAANGYLAMPLDTGALRVLSSRILAAAEPVESADDAVIEDADLQEVLEEPGAASAPAEGAANEPAPADPAPGGEAPPPIARRPQRSVLTEEDRIFADRVFQSVAEHRDALVAESHRRRPPPRRDLLQTQEGRLQLLRDDLKWRKAQLARLAEVWAVRERELASFDERMHERDVEVQGLKLQVEDLLRRLADARDLFVEKEREFGASIDDLLVEKFGQEKELIEVVAANERRNHELERELRRRDDDLAQRKLALSEAQEEIARLERQGRAELERSAVREEELQSELARRAEENAAAAEVLARARREAEEAARTAGVRLEALERERASLDAAVQGLRGELEAAARAREEARAAAEERERALVADREQKLRLLDDEYRQFRDGARAREDDLSREIQDHLQQIGALEGEIEGLSREMTDREEELRAEMEELRQAEVAEHVGAEHEALDSARDAARRADEAERALAASGEALAEARAATNALETALAAAREAAEGGDAAREAEREEAGKAIAAAQEEGERQRALADGAGRERDALRQALAERDAGLAERDAQLESARGALAAARAEAGRLAGERDAAEERARAAEERARSFGDTIE